ncbi:MAG: patatin-like phospholipase family protein [Propionibacteriaceae bacterium]|jgi:NTE family protein|nr:patatin-like phospholipase family protein [Propionibacteriaceae bacterium]
MAKISLVLGSGGARGYAHIGVIQVLKEQGHTINAVSGTSIGSLIGGLEAVGKLDEYTDWVTGMSQRDVIWLLDPKLGSGGALGMERVFTRMRELYGGAHIEDLPIPYTAVATDLGNRREVWFQSGLLATAVRASVSIPGVITPIMVNGRLLVDGGVVNPVPIEPVMSADSDLTVAVSLSGWTPPDFGSSPVKSSSWISSLLSKLTGKEPAPEPEPDYEEPPADLGIAEVTARALETMGALITRYRLAAQQPDVLITVPHDSAHSMDFHRAEDLIALGRELAEAALREQLPEAPNGQPPD